MYSLSGYTLVFAFKPRNNMKYLWLCPWFPSEFLEPLRPPEWQAYLLLVIMSPLHSTSVYANERLQGFQVGR